MAGLQKPLSFSNNIYIQVHSAESRVIFRYTRLRVAAFYFTDIALSALLRHSRYPATLINKGWIMHLVLFCLKCECHISNVIR
ncbi:Hypoticical protein [Pectobacterium parmentieri]|uniref:Hypoticical protein n=1 Tax=Pectobacterium parmentieri TaxID=1905730 RepID=A0A0H3IC09_PECPM|nr:Hypoticical protein [Pectobacterium parmentieri]